MEPIRLWRTWGDEADSRPFDTSPNFDYDEEYAALPRAEYDALTAEAADARTLRAERDSLAKEREQAVLSAVAWRSAQQVAAERLNAATARAEKADERAKAAEALLREARGCVAVNYGPNEFSRLLARIDALLSATDGDAPTPDDRKGEDGAWIKP